MLDDIIAYAQSEWHLFPLKPRSKEPATRHGFRDATTDTASIKQCWSKHPDFNVGIATGAVCGIFVIDIDPRHGGDETLADLESEHGKLPDTVEALTGGGGRHIYFKHPGGRVPCGEGKLGAGVDVKGDGGYVVAPPSVHPNGKAYEWELSSVPGEVEVAEAPQWLVDLVVSPEGTPSDGATKFQFDPSGAEEVAIAKSALEALKAERADSYETWVKVGMILKSVDPGPAMLELWDAWSRQSSKYQPGESARKWRTFDPNGTLTLPTLTRMAREDSGGTFKVKFDRPAATQPRKAEPREVLKFKPFPVNALPNPVDRYVNDASKALGCDASYVALPLLSSLAAAIGNSRRVRLKKDWHEPAILWTCIVGPSGTLKSPAIAVATRSVYRREAEASKVFQEEYEVFEAEAEAYETEIREWRRTRTGDRPGKPAKPVHERYIVSDTTVEGVVPILRDSPRGVLLVRDELSGWLRSHDCYKGGRGGDTAHWLSMYGAMPVIVDRRTNSATIFVPRASVSITGGIQLGILRDTLGQEHFEDGLAARLLLAMPPRRRKRWTEAEIDLGIEAALDVVFDRLYGLDLDEEKPVDLGLAEEGRRAWVRFYDEHAGILNDLDGDLAAAFSKLEAAAARLTLVFHCVRVAADDRALRAPDRIDDGSIEAGVRLVRWFGHEVRRVYGELAIDEAERETRRLLDLIERHDGAVSPRDLTRASRRYPTAEDAEKALIELVRAGRGRWENVPPPSGRGPHKRCFILSKTEAQTDRIEDDSEENSKPVGVDTPGDAPKRERFQL